MLKRDNYRAIKRMDRAEMSAYYQRVYEAGYTAAMQGMHGGKIANSPDVDESIGEEYEDDNQSAD